jgi:hypothetical protein
MVSTAGGENGETWADCAVGTTDKGICAGGTMVAGTAVFGLGPVAGRGAAGASASGLCLAGTCMGIESMPIWTDGPEAGVPATGMRGVVEGGATIGAGVMFTSCTGPEPLGGKTDVGMMVGPMATKASGGGGTAVLATLMGVGISIGGGVGGYMSGTGTGLGAGAAPAWSLAPHPRQNL